MEKYNIRREGDMISSGEYIGMQKKRAQRGWIKPKPS